MDPIDQLWSGVIDESLQFHSMSLHDRLWELREERDSLADVVRELREELDDLRRMDGESR